MHRDEADIEAHGPEFFERCMAEFIIHQPGDDHHLFAEAQKLACSIKSATADHDRALGKGQTAAGPERPVQRPDPVVIDAADNDYFAHNHTYLWSTSGARASTIKR